VSTVAVLVFARCAGFVFRAPGFSHPSVPHAVRVILACALTIAITPVVEHRSLAEPLVALAIPLEFGIGSAIGMAASVLYDAAYAGGRLIDDYVGVKAVAPTIALVAPSGFGRVFSIAATGGFFLSGAYRFTIASLGSSFATIAPADAIVVHDWYAFAAALIGTIAAVAASVAAPAIALALVAQIALAAMSRIVPRFSSFALSFPLVFGAVLTAAAVAIPVVTINAASPLLPLPWVHK
jgi:flagellar biosynthetic protein FliR